MEFCIELCYNHNTKTRHMPFRGDNMERFINYIEQSLAGITDGKVSYKFKRKTLDEMNEREKTLEKRGLLDKTVREELVISEYPDLVGAYNDFALEAKRKRTTKRRIVTNGAGSVVYLIVLLSVYLKLSFSTQNWEKTWVLLVGGVLLWVVYLMFLFVIRITRMRQIFHAAARLLLAGCIMLVSTVVFICSLEFFRFDGYWCIFIGGVALALVADALYASFTKKRLAMLCYLIYIPIIGAMIYIILSALGFVLWNSGWLIIIFALVVDVAIVVGSLVKNSVERWEVVSAWKEED